MPDQTGGVRILSALALAFLVTIAMVHRAQAAVIIQFEEVGGNVVATTTGTFQVPVVEWAVSGSGAGLAFGNSDSLLYIGATFGSWPDTGTTTPSGLSVGPDFGSGDTFGYFFGSIYLPPDIILGSIFTPNTMWTWTGQTLASIGLGSLTGTPVPVFEYGDTIYFATVPEPATTEQAGSDLDIDILRR